MAHIWRSPGIGYTRQVAAGAFSPTQHSSIQLLFEPCTYTISSRRIVWHYSVRMYTMLESDAP